MDSRGTYCTWCPRRMYETRRGGHTVILSACGCARLVRRKIVSHRLSIHPKGRRSRRKLDPRTQRIKSEMPRTLSPESSFQTACPPVLAPGY
uniref:Uncharacterized protein n=1 Tax=Neospora caninum (strain Liverpool) TaxID=572307 RepID=A0A0F7UAK0_NEOCL|nr:TPA: hypothetical protein BN1204_015105 [Neospora caninum Liverpool]